MSPAPCFGEIARATTRGTSKSAALSILRLSAAGYLRCFGLGINSSRPSQAEANQICLQERHDGLRSKYPETHAGSACHLQLVVHERCGPMCGTRLETQHRYAHDRRHRMG